MPYRTRRVLIVLAALAGAATAQITNVSPGSNLLAPGSTSVALSFNTATAAFCRYSVGSLQPIASMQPFDSGPASTSHSGTVQGLSPSPGVVNNVYLACDSNPTNVTTLQYRAVASPSGSFPRIGSIWFGSYIAKTQPSLLNKIQMFLNPAFSNQQMLAVRAANPNVLMFTNVNAMETAGYTDPPNVPEAYYLHDTTGKRIPNWPTPGDYILNLTKPEVADFLANYAYQVLLNSGLMLDGIFFDNFSTAISYVKTDYAGNPVTIDADNNGQPDDPATDDAEWSAGVYRLIAGFHKLAPYALATGHLGSGLPLAATLAAFNGTSMNGDPPRVREGFETYDAMSQTLGAWFSQGQLPGISLLQSSPPLQVAYGYGFSVTQTMLPATQTFGQTFYPNMRFGLGSALMNDGFSTYDFGDTASNVSWWYDEYDFNLGLPLGLAANIGTTQTVASLLTNGGMESGSLAPWQTFSGSGGGKASTVLDTSISAEGNASAHVTVSVAATNPWLITFEQDNLTITNGVTYQVRFWARSDTPRTLTVNCQGGSPNFTNYGLYAQFQLGPSWKLYTTSFTSPATGNDARLEFQVGDSVGNVWFDGVQLNPSGNNTEIYRRDFTNGIAVLNASSASQTVSLESGLKKFSGAQAPKYQYIVDDTDTGFTTSGAWSAVTMDSGFGHGNKADGPGSQLANGPYYHAWEKGVHQSADTTASATWSLHIPADDRYTIQVWLPAAPNAATWTTAATYEVVSGAQTLATVTLDQTSAQSGDAWHTLGTWSLTASGGASLRLHNLGGGTLIADAVYLTSASLYNDGLAASQVSLNPYDAILLQRQAPAAAPSSRVTQVAGSADYGPNIASGSFVSIFGTGFTTTTRQWQGSDFNGDLLPTSLSGVSVTINGLPAAVEYISPTQINVIAPDDATVGQVAVQVTTPQGKSYPGTATKMPAAPAFFQFTDSGTTMVAARHVDGSLVAKSAGHPAQPGEIISIFGTGFGATSPATSSTTLVSVPNPIAKAVTVTIGGVNANVTYAGVTLAGVAQLNVQVPADLPPGNQPVVASAAGFQTVSAVYLPVAN
jgi:uncharacterized protein (TIGR03437 family)